MAWRTCRGQSFGIRLFLYRSEKKRGLRFSISAIICEELKLKFSAGLDFVKSPLRAEIFCVFLCKRGLTGGGPPSPNRTDEA